MGASHAQIWCKKCYSCVLRYPIPFCFMLLLFLLYMFFPLVYKIFIYSSPLVGISFVVHRVFLGIDRDKKIKKAEQDDKRKKFAKSRRSFKSNRTHLQRRNTKTKSDNINYSDTDVDDRDDIFSMSLFELLADKATLMEKNKIGEVNVGPVVGKGESSSSNNYRKYDNVKDDHKYESEGVSCDEDHEPRDKAFRWTEDDQKNVKMDLGLIETERNKRLEGMIQRRRSRKNLGYQEKGATEDNKNSQVPAVKVVKINPFLEVKSCDTNVPGSAPSSLLTTHNPFDLPYDPHEEKPDLISGDNFHEEFTVNHHKEPMFCRHQSFSLGAFSHPDATHDNRDMSFYKNLATKRFTLAELGTSNVGESSNRVVGLVHEKDGTERKSKEIDVDSYDSGSSTMLDERKADIMFFYGGKKRLGHAPSNSVVSDLQVELSDEETSLKDLDLEKERGSWLNLSNLSRVSSEVVLKSDGEDDHVPLEINSGIISSVVSTDLPSSSTQEMDNMPQSLNSDTVENNQLQESSATDGLTGLADRQAHVTSSSPKSVLERGFSNEVQQSNNQTREAENGLHL